MKLFLIFKNIVKFNNNLEYNECYGDFPLKLLGAHREQQKLVFRIFSVYDLLFCPFDIQIQFLYEDIEPALMLAHKIFTKTKFKKDQRCFGRN